MAQVCPTLRRSDAFTLLLILTITYRLVLIATGLQCLLQAITEYMVPAITYWLSVLLVIVHSFDFPITHHGSHLDLLFIISILFHMLTRSRQDPSKLKLMTLTTEITIQTPP